MIPFPEKKYNIIYADPPWAYPESGSKAKVHDKHYKCMALKDICNMPVNKITSENCALLIWVTMPRLFDSYKVIKAWGFEYKTVAFNWVKRNKKNDNYFLGCGSYTRSNSEICLLALKGKMYGMKKSCSVRQICDARVEKHSKKPDEIRDRITELFGDLPRIELFAREKNDGWDAWGNEVENAQKETLFD
jgi:N6-adenosine-specific RNA methylase IME4